MAKSNCKADDSAPPQAFALQLTPCFHPLSFSNKSFQVTGSTPLLRICLRTSAPVFSDDILYHGFPTNPDLNNLSAADRGFYFSVEFPTGKWRI